MRRMWLVVTTMILVAILAGASPAGAQSGCEIAHECEPQSQDYILTSDAPLSTTYYAWNPGTQNWEDMYLYELARLCTNYGGYYYLGADGYTYWQYC